MESPEIKRPVALILGGTSPHAELCRILKRRGFRTILIDYLETSPAQNVADEHLRESTLDQDRVLEIARERQASLVIATCIDQANVTACYVLEKLGNHAPYSYETALAVSNKITMKSVMIENGIPTSRFVRISDPASTEWSGLNFPLIVKPCDSNGSKGVRRCDAPEEVTRHLPAALTISRTKEAVVEEFKEGREIAFDSYVLDGQLHLLITRERRKIKGSADSIQQIYGSFWPASISQEAVRKLVEIGEQIARAFRLDNTPLMVQTIVSEDEVNVIEFAPRIGGGENYRVIRMATGFCLIDAAIDSFLGNRPQLDYGKPENLILDNYLYAKPSVFGRIEGLERLLEEGMISSYQAYKPPGCTIGEGISSNNRVAAFTVSADSEEQGIRKLRDAVNRIEIFDKEDNPVMIRHIY
jgi:biotin carboxylase